MNVNTNIKLTNDERELFSMLNTVAEKNNVTLRAVGGWTRDKLIGLDSSDIDIMVDNMTGEQFARIVTQYIAAKDPHVIKANPEKSKHLETAKCFIPLSSGKIQEVDFAQARKEIYHEESRVPTISNATPEEDAHRRDLTINSLFYNLHTKQIEDFTGKGLKDLITNTFRTPENPIKTFMDDPLRIFRVIRFAAKYNGNIDQETYAAMKNPQLREMINAKVSKERIGQEFLKMLKNPNPDIAIGILKDTGLLHDIFTASLKGTKYEGKVKELDMQQNNPNHKLSLWEHTFEVIKHTLDMYKEAEPEKRIVMILAALTHDLGKLYEEIQEQKPPSEKYPGHDIQYTTYKGHERESKDIASQILKYLKIEPYIQQVSGLAEHHMRPHLLEREDSNIKSMRKFIRIMGEQALNWIDVFNLSVADAYAKGKSVDPETVKRYEDLRSKLESAVSTSMNKPLEKFVPILNGEEIMMTLNIKPGPYMKEITEYIKELMDDNPQITKTEAIQKIKEKYGHLSSQKTAKSIFSATDCPKHLLNKRADEIAQMIEDGAYKRAEATINRLVSDYDKDDMVIRLACVTLYKTMLNDPKTRNNDLLQKIFNIVEDNFSDPILNAYATGILLLIKTPNDEETILKLGKRSSDLSPEITMNVISSLPKNNKDRELTKKIYEYLSKK